MSRTAASGEYLKFFGVFVRCVHVFVFVSYCCCCCYCFCFSFVKCKCGCLSLSIIDPRFYQIFSCYVPTQRKKNMCVIDFSIVLLCYAKLCYTMLYTMHNVYLSVQHQWSKTISLRGMYYTAYYLVV